MSYMKQSKIAIPGGGNMGTSLAKGLVASKQFTRREILITEKRESRIAYLKSLGFRVADNNHEAVSQGGIEIGFDSEMSQLIAAQTVKGASGLILETTLNGKSTE